MVNFNHCARFVCSLSRYRLNRLPLQYAEKVRMHAVSGVHYTPESNVASLLAGSSSGVDLLSWYSSCLVLAAALPPPPLPPEPPS